ncbi:MAG: hypothetical protein ACR2L1_01485 [Pyrinomonadaceae bacterium]
MRSNFKFLYLLGALITLKLFFLAMLFRLNGGSFGHYFPIFAHSMQYLFKILFMLFIISPPLIVVFLYLIWKELKDRNKLK